ncbi:hypothetical protein [Burkholderia sp. Ac-20344]|uniref:hypothetical protein n=1 Tax=Burkholderia sp. Ac-20344 TaxID=2703890 RepID=UPI00197B7250|nr:hypothetical protein [Burkholderia sp. Ac-20344]MBN3831854.1 hypothetical protein [Burkholderia sp. Ac-20344]
MGLAESKGQDLPSRDRYQGESFMKSASAWKVAAPRVLACTVVAIVAVVADLADRPLFHSYRRRP